ncbi:ABC transporter ATP-binding protein [Rhodobacteraceae bacterium KMM 6894]|nr:ABC transporter ATP-binding protein [Rhodobacteraceae bacterium KMM 6894]
MSAPLLSVRDLSVDFRTRGGLVHALDGVSFELNAGETLGIVGESGSGKSVTAFAIMGILERAARVRSGAIHFQGRDVMAMSARDRDLWRGAAASIIFQNPRTALNPIRRVGQQIADVIARHTPDRAPVIREKVLEAMRQVRIPDPEKRMAAYPYELSDGLCQRIGIAAALACNPRLLIADEPTSGLDVTTQAVILDMIRDIARAGNLGAILITHDLALAAQYCDRILVMHAGQVVETAPVGQLFATPRHPYTAGLLGSVPSMVDSVHDLCAIPGSLPDLRRTDLPPCRFAERCTRRLRVCDQPGLALEQVSEGQFVACRNPL